MNAELWEITKLAIMAILGGASGFAIQHYRRPSDQLKTSTDTITQLIAQVEGLVRRDIEKEKRIDALQEQVNKLEEMNKLYMKALERAKRFIKMRIPNEEPPDFMDTQDLRPLMK